MSREFVLEHCQVVDRPLEEVFAFFADARNLATITPDWLGFEIVTPQPIEMAEGKIIDYHIKLRGIPMRWRSKITAWEPPRRFIDEQVHGPYRFWIHEHSFDAIDDRRTRVRDRVRYGVPGGVLVQKMFVAGDLDRIFRFRSQRLSEILEGVKSVSK